MGHSSDPLTRKEIKDTTHLVPNKNLRKAIKDWRQRHALQIFVKTEHKTITLWVDVCDTTISTIRRKIKDKGIAVGWNFEDSDVNGGNSSNPKKRSKHLRSLWYASKYLEDNRTLGYYGIEPESTLWLGG
uniref:U-box domain-containing protein n=2 Tax=Amorphochlora amoebiformis TaxID=1561963 RepID=A0A7S0D440_9EUKA|mmetsp:Transcript_17647/g.28122  ORF Transcript_17647/g.28122 Transcript_17647/m.28122 type:complete len:130 (+) Transcript_17647:223-612(+)